MRAAARSVRREALVVMGLIATVLVGCEEAEGRPFDLGDGRVLTLFSLAADTKETANGRRIGYLSATFAPPDGLSQAGQRALAEDLCPRILSEMGAPDEVDGAALRTVLITYREPGPQFLGFGFGATANYWIDLARGECVTHG